MRMPLYATRTPSNCRAASQRGDCLVGAVAQRSSSGEMGHEVRQRPQVRVVKRLHDVGHRRDPAADARAGLELAQRLQQVILALPGEPRRGLLGRPGEVVFVARSAAVGLNELRAGCAQRRRRPTRSRRDAAASAPRKGRDVADVVVRRAMPPSAASPGSCACRCESTPAATAGSYRAGRRATASSAISKRLPRRGRPRRPAPWPRRRSGRERRTQSSREATRRRQRHATDEISFEESPKRTGPLGCSGPVARRLGAAARARLLAVADAIDRARPSRRRPASSRRAPAGCRPGGPV